MLTTIPISVASALVVQDLAAPNHGKAGQEMTTFTPEQQEALDALKQRDHNESDRDKARKYSTDKEINGQDSWIWFWTTGLFLLCVGAYKWGSRVLELLG
jgi:hypothetical protein